MNALRLRADKPRRAIAADPAAGAKSGRLSRSGLRNLLKRGATVVVVSGIAVAGFSAFTASSTNATGTAFANQGLAISSLAGAPSGTASATSIADLAAQRSHQLATDGDAISDSQQSAAAGARSSSLDGEAAKIATEIDRLNNLAKFMWPTEGTVSSPYGMRMHPILHYMRLHDGDDIGGKCGQPIWAAQSGVVVKAESGYNGGSGNNVRIDHGKINGVDVQSGYLHMQRYVVSVGQKVNQGDVVGYVGDTGLSTACHLHFSMYENGHGLDPMKYIGWNPQAKDKGDGHGEG